MTTPITVSIPHDLGRLEARRRIDNGFSKFVAQVPGGTGSNDGAWDGDRKSFSVGAFGQSVAGSFVVLDKSVTIEIQLPGMLAALASGVRDKLQKAGQLLLTRK